MTELILIFFPTFISLNIIKNRENKNYKDLMLIYPIYNIIINILSFGVLFYFKNRQLILFSENSNSVGFCFRFLILSSVLALIMPYAKEFIFNNIKIEIKTRRTKNETKK